MQDLIKQYNTTLRQLREAQKDAKEEDIKILTDMISDISYSLEWMKKARRPGNRRGIERLAAYQRERTCDPLLMQRYFRSMDDNLYEWDNRQQEHAIGEWDKIRLEDALSLLTEREKEVYRMYSILRASINEALFKFRTSIVNCPFLVRGYIFPSLL